MLIENLQSCNEKLRLFDWSFSENSSLRHIQPQIFQGFHLSFDKNKPSYKNYKYFRACNDYTVIKFEGKFVHLQTLHENNFDPKSRTLPNNAG